MYYTFQKVIAHMSSWADDCSNFDPTSGSYDILLLAADADQFFVYGLAFLAFWEKRLIPIYVSLASLAKDLLVMLGDQLIPNTTLPGHLCALRVEHRRNDGYEEVSKSVATCLFFTIFLVTLDMWRGNIPVFHFVTRLLTLLAILTLNVTSRLALNFNSANEVFSAMVFGTFSAILALIFFTGVVYPSMNRKDSLVRKAFGWIVVDFEKF